MSCIHSYCCYNENNQKDNSYKEKKRKQIEYVLKLRAKVPKSSFNYVYLLLEIITHLIQPLPYIDQTFKFTLLGIKITYSVD